MRFITTALMAGAALAPGLQLPLYLMEVPPMTIDAPVHKGIVGDIVDEAMRRAQIAPRLVMLPSPRALAEVPETHDALIIPLARLPSREANYTWIAPIVKVQRAFFTMGKRVDSFSQAKATFKTVAVSRSTIGLDILLAQGFSRAQIVEVNQGETGAKMLLAGRFDAWYNVVSESQVLLADTDPQHRVVHGAMLGDTYNYLACSKICNPLITAKLTAALRSMAADGSMQRIAARYPNHEGLTLVAPDTYVPEPK